MSKAAPKIELPRYVGYAEIAEATGIDRRTIQRLMERGKFPKPDALPTKENRWRLSVVADWLEQRSAEQLAALSDSAVTDPAKLKPEQVVDALEALASRFIALHGEQVQPGDVLSVGVQRQLTDEQRSAIAHNAAAEQRELVAGIVDRLDGLHYVEALMLQRAFLPPLRRFADAALTQLGIEISMTDAEYRAAAMLIVERMINGETLPAETHPLGVIETLTEDGVLRRAPK